MGTQETEEKHLKNMEKFLYHLKEEMSQLKLCHRRRSDSVSPLQSYDPHGGKYLKILQSIGNAVHILDTQFRIIYWNLSAEKLFGYAAEEVLGQKGVEVLVDPNKYVLAYEILYRVKMGESWAGQFPVKNKAWDRFVVASTSTPLYDDDGTFVGVICVSNDSRAFLETTVPFSSGKNAELEASKARNKELVNQKNMSSALRSESQAGESSSSAKDYEILWEDLTIGESIGQGSCGTVYHALWIGSDVAVKVFPMQEDSDDLMQSFKQEVSLMARLRHPNILLFMGAVTSPERLCIVTEFLPRGSLFRLLRKNTTKLDWRRRVQMAIDIARGVSYLHRCNPSIVHRDLKSPNLLIDKNWTVKVGDFGLSRIKHATYLTSTGKVMPQWMAPEVIRDEPSNEKSDVYCFGVIMWELATEKVPWETLNAIQVIAAVGFTDRRLEIPNDIDPQWASIIERCWHSDPASRPRFQELLERLKELQRR